MNLNRGSPICLEMSALKRMIRGMQAIKSIKWLLFVALIVHWNSDLSFAARGGLIEKDQVNVFEMPNQTSRILGQVKKGEGIVVSNLPTNDFYKVRTMSGLVGWIFNNQMVLDPVPTASEIEKGLDGARGSGSRHSLGHVYHFHLGSFFSFPFFYGLQWLQNVSNLNIRADAGGVVGGELGIFLFSRMSVLVRVESFFESMLVTDNTTARTFKIELKSFPLSLGVRLQLIRLSSVVLNLSVLGGMGYKTSLSSSDVTIPEQFSVNGNLVTITSNPFSALATMDVEWKLSRYFSLLAEGGYRYLRTLPVSLVNIAASGVVILQPQFVLNLSGWSVGAGMRLAF